MSDAAAEPCTTFDLPALARELRAEPAYAREGHTARTLMRAPDLRVVLVVMRAGSVIREHGASETAQVHALEGEVRLVLRDGEVVLPRDRLAVLAAGCRHEVRATVDCAFLLTLGWSSRA